MSYTPPPPPAGGGYSAAGGGAGDVPANLADPIKRLIAALIDWGIVVGLVIAAFVLALVFGAISDALGVIVAILGYLAAIGFGIYNLVVTQGNTGQSIGKKMQAIKVVSEETGQPLGVGGAFIRWLIHQFIDGICFAGYIYGFFVSPKRQTVGDIVAKSLVVNA
jgi:uncharacterized RDD family membrane protein YckC